MENEVIIHKVKLVDLIKGNEGEIITLQDYNVTKKDLEKLAKKHSKFVVTKENLKEALLIRLELREPRYGLDKIQKHNNALMNDAKKVNKDTLESLVAIIRGTEDKIHAGIQEIENEKKIAKEKKEKEELERVANINSRIVEWGTSLERGYLLAHKSVENFEDFKTMIERLKMDKFDEFQFQGEDLALKYEEKLSEVALELKATKEKEEESKRLAIENEKLKKEQVEREKKAKIAQDKLDKDKEKLEKEKKAFDDKVAAAKKIETDKIAAKEKEDEALKMMNQLKADFISENPKSKVNIDNLNYADLQGLLLKSRNELKEKAEKAKTEATKKEKAEKIKLVEPILKQLEAGIDELVSNYENLKTNPEIDGEVAEFINACSENLDILNKSLLN